MLNEVESSTYINDLLSSIRHQAKAGGMKEPNVAIRDSMAGPYWKRKIWNAYCSRVKKDLIEYGYDEQQAEKLIEENSVGVILYD